MARRTDSADLPRVFRADRIDVSTAHLLPPVRQADGSLLVSGYVARPGVLVYRRPDGSVQRELVTADELKASAAGIARKTLTVEHPAEDVSPATVGTVGVGDVGSRVQVIQDTGYVQVDMVIRRQDGLAAFAAGIQELSPGYSCGLDITPGVDPVFGPYDAIQVGREYNHLALCESARGGPTIRARADSADVAIQIPTTSEAPLKLLMIPGFITLLDRLGVPAAKRTDDDGALAAAGAAAEAIAAAAPQVAANAAMVADLQKNVSTLEAALTEAKAQLAAASGAPAMPSPAEIEEEVAGALEADPMLDAAGAPAALPAAMPKDAAAAGPIRMDAIRRGVLRAVAEHQLLNSRCDSTGIPATERLAKVGAKKLRKSVLAKADPKARQDGSVDYDRARIDALGDRRADSTGRDAFAGFFNGAADPGADRKDAADKHEDAVMPSPVKDAYDRKWKLGRYATA